MIALIDGDVLVYRCAFAAEKTKYLVSHSTIDHAEQWYYLYDAYKDIPKGTPKDAVWSRKEVEPEEQAIAATRATLQSILNKLGTDKYELYLSGEKSFREELAVSRKYKGNRDAQVRPVHYSAVRSSLLSDFSGRVCEGGLEADDMLGTRATSLGDSSVIVSIDKDLLQIPGKHFNWVSGDDVVTIGTRDAFLNLGCQILSGDPTDNVQGLPGIGPVKARKLLESSSGTSDMLARIRGAYHNHPVFGGDRGAAEYSLCETTSLVYILREGRKTEALEWLEKHAA